MPTNYPTGLDTTTQLPNNQTDDTPLNRTGVDHAQEHVNLSDAVRAIQAELGISPSGPLATVAARFSASFGLNVKDFGGAVGDGVANDEAAIQGTINQVVSLGGGAVYLPRGAYNAPELYVTSDGTAMGTKVDGVQIVGEGRYNTRLNGVLAVGRQDVDSPNDNNTGTGTPQTSNGIVVRGFTLTGGLELYGVQRHSILFDVRIIPTGVSQGLLARYSNTLQLFASRIDGGATTIDGARFETCPDMNCWGVGFNAARKGVVVTKANSGDNRATNVWYRGCHFEGNNHQAILLDSIGSGAIHGCTFIGNDKNAPGSFATIDIDGGAATANDVRGFTVRDNWFSADTIGTGVGIRADRCLGVTIGGGRITNFNKGIEITATAQKVWIEPNIVYDTVTDPVDDSLAAAPAAVDTTYYA